MIDSESWITVERPGYQGKKKDEQVARWNEIWGLGNWRIMWELSDGQIWNYDQMFWRIYVPGYFKSLSSDMATARLLADNYSYAYDIDLITKEEAFDPYALYNKPGRPNQFHNVAFNIAMEDFVGLPFIGSEPLHVRGGKPGTPKETWPKGWRYHPGIVPTVRPDLIPANDIKGWWDKGTVEEAYQVAKVMQVKEKIVFRPDRDR